MEEDQATGREAIAELRERVRLIEARVAQIEHGQVSSVPRPAPGAAQVSHLRPDADLAVAKAFTRVAMLSFVLLGALILRILTQQRILATGFGTLLGFAYAGHLIVLSFLPGRMGRLARKTSLFQCCGVVLSFSIALESSLRTDTLTRFSAMVVMAGFAALALAVATAHRKASLAATALVGVLLALVALGLDSNGLGWQLASLVLFAAAAAALSWRRTWAFLRPLVFPLFLLLLGVGFALAHRESLGRGPLLATAAVFWAVIVLQHLLAFRRWGWGAMWLPLATGWLAGLAWLETWPLLTVVAVAVFALAVAMSAAPVRRYPEAGAGTAGLAATAVISGMIGWTALDSSGVLCALAGTALGIVVHRSQPAWAAVFAAILMMTAAIRGVLSLLQPAVSPYALALGTLLAAILLAHFLRTERSRAASPAGLVQGVAPLALVAGLVVFFAVARDVVRRLFPDPASLLLAQTGILAVVAAFLTFCGHAGRRRAVVYCGLACMVIAIGKVGLIDLRQLNGIRLLASIVLLGLSSVGVSASLRRRG